MTKQQILQIFVDTDGFLRPDDVRLQLSPRPDRRSLYSYLLRLARQGLLERDPHPRRGELAYCLTEREHARLRYFRSQQR
jgi:DNA-binding PadR family transcriptional regulator